MKIGLVYKNYEFVYLREMNFQPSEEDKVIQEGVHFYLKESPINVVLGLENDKLIIKKIEQIYYMEP